MDRTLNVSLTRKFFAVALACGVLGAAVRAADYADIRTGSLSGKLVVQWLKPDVFLFIPDVAQPLTFKRSDGTTIRPGRMVTDGGSIPQPLRVFRNYSSWGYAPAFIVHDWIFRLNYCRIEGYQNFDVQKAADVMAEVIKTMMESGKVEKDETTLELMHRAVSSRFAKRLWDEGRCLPVPPTFTGEPIHEFVIDFGPSPER